MMEDFFAFLIASILLIFGTVLGGVLLWKIIDMIRNSIKGKRNTEYEESFDRMARAFINHKKETEQRLQNIEAIISQTNESSHHKKLDTPQYERIEIEKTNVKEENRGEVSKLSNNLNVE